MSKFIRNKSHIKFQVLEKFLCILELERSSGSLVLVLMHLRIVRLYGVMEARKGLAEGPNNILAVVGLEPTTFLIQ